MKKRTRDMPDDMTKTVATPPWEVLHLFADRLDPKSLAAAASVSRSWSAAMSADHLWGPLCRASCPSLCCLHTTAAVPYSRIYSLGVAAGERLRQSPPDPRISVGDLTFSVDAVLSNGGDRVAAVVVPAAEARPSACDVFEFEMDVGGGGAADFAAEDRLRITWNVVFGGFKSVFTAMECGGKGSFVVGQGWFSKELPAAGGGVVGGEGSGLVAELRLGLREVGGGRMAVEKITVGIMSAMSWRFVRVDDALRYLEYFLLPENRN
ncbi:Probable F-box protein [Striga hermonthica]|uniref:F-box protein n=1 Tax=Striga hermonthica TaxID=68872 RepID=A0A9N7NZ37_STRHE|nr:Probable F-box protein [Striga hermonthica]